MNLSNLVPDYIFDHVTAITPDFLREKQLDSVILDIDNTLAKHNKPTPDKGVVEWVENLKEEGFKILLISNNGKDRVSTFASLVDCPFIASASKPATKAYKEAVRRLETTRDKTAAVGDQIFTDVWGANRAGVTSILVNPISPAENIVIKCKRKFENRYIKKYHRRNKKQ